MGPVGRCTRRIALAGVLLLAMLGIAESAKAAGWGPEIELRQGLMTLPLATHMDDEGNATVIAASIFGSTSLAGIEMLRIEDGKARPVFSTDIASGSFDPTEVTFSGIDANGRVSLAWSECECDGPSRIKVAAVDPDGSQVNPQPFEVATFPIGIEVLSLNYDVAPNGTAVISAVLADASDDTWVEAYRIDRDQTEAVKITTSGSTGEGAIRTMAGISDSGRALIAWETGHPVSGAEKIAARSFDRNGPAGAELEIATDAGFDDLLLTEVFVDHRDLGTVIFSGDDGDGAGAAFRRIDTATGAPLKPAATPIVPLALSYFLNRNNIAMAADGSIQILYPVYEIDGDDESIEAWSIRIDPQGSVLPAHRISDTEIGAPVALALRGDGSGAALYLGADEMPDLSDPDDFDSLRVPIRFRPLGSDGRPVAPGEVIGQTYPALFDSGLVFSLSVTNGLESMAAWPQTVGLFPAAHGIVRIYDATPPVLEIRAPNRVMAGEEAVLAATVKDRGPVTTSWSFGDGGTASGEVVSHVFKRAGKYRVELRGVDAVGNEARVSREITVYADRASRIRPDTRITRPPALRLYRRQAAIHFRSSQKDATFECRIGRGPIAGSREARLRRAGKGGRGLVVQTKWRRCSSPLRLRKLHRAVYVVRIRAVSKTGLKDATPAITRFRVLRPTKRSRIANRNRNQAR